MTREIPNTGGCEFEWPYVEDLAPESPGVFMLWDGNEIVLIGKAPDTGWRTIRAALNRLRRGGYKGNVIFASHCEWECHQDPNRRYEQLVKQHSPPFQRRPRYNRKALRQ